MEGSTKKLSNPLSVSGSGVYFENHVQSAFAVLLLTGGYAPCLPLHPIKKIKLQGKYLGYDTDDLIIFVNDSKGSETKILGQIKHTIQITKNNPIFSEVIDAAWNDFNNPKIFNSNSDVIALITGPLSAADIENVRWLLEEARYSENSSDFINKVEMANFSSKLKRSKLEAFRTQLEKSNKGMISDDQLWCFLKHFYLLGYDLDIKTGVTLSLLHTLIGQYSPENFQKIWYQVMDEVKYINQNAGIITKETFPHDIRDEFKEKVSKTIPKKFIPTPPPKIIINVASRKDASDLAIALLIGSWDDSSEKDREAISLIAGSPYRDWIKIIREAASQPESPYRLKNGKWYIDNRLQLLDKFGPSIFDEYLDRFSEVAITVLGENDRKIDLPPNEQIIAGIEGKVLTYSTFLRKGLAEGLAIIGSYPASFSSCSIGKSETTATITARKILSETDWIRWATLNDLLPLLAESSPQEFLDAVDKAMECNPCPFESMFAYESSEIFGRTYMAGLLWALETLAWDPEYLVRSVITLGELAVKDPGGRWGNRPRNSLTAIFLPWLPQTCAPMVKRKIAIKTLIQEQPQIAWEIIISLLPQSHQTTSGSRKPEWRKFLNEGCEKRITKKEYWEQIRYYSELATKLAKQDPKKVEILIDHIEKLPLKSFNDLLKYLSSKKILSLPDAAKLPLWDKLTHVVSKHRKYADTEWAMKPEIVDKIASVGDKISPLSPYFYHQPLFNARTAFELFDDKLSFEELQQKMEYLHRKAIEDIIQFGGVDTVIKFADEVNDALSVGVSLGSLISEHADEKILPSLLEPIGTPHARFAEGYVRARFYSLKWGWVDNFEMSLWSPTQIGLFLSYLPSSSETWSRVSQLLGENEKTYWASVNASFIKLDENNLKFVVERLVKYDRSNVAISLLFFKWNQTKILNPELTTKTLLASINSIKALSQIDEYEISELIKALQDDSGTNPEDLFSVEWAYLPLIDHPGSRVSAKSLESKLANDPKFFCEVIRTAFRSKKDKDKPVELTEKEKIIALNAYRLSDGWKIPPGTKSDGSFDGDGLKKWYNAVKKECMKSGHLEIAMIHFGQVLIYTPKDPDGLFIHRSAAKILNEKDTENIREGFRVALLNSRGVFTYSEGKEEKKLEDKYRQDAEQAESRGFFRLAEALKKLAKSYEHDAERAEKVDPFDL
ncbi:MAG: hypothetical protein ABSG49_08870 [Methanoregula sp.]|jgi:hypothetical protein|uniref:hypothetical protein n=1 Tax=Methanoregula sp. TaxID=2052170 RepID=UPI003C14F14E